MGARAQRGRWLAVGILAGLVLVGCGSGDSFPATGGPQTLDKDAAAARDILLTAEDLPGYIANPHEHSEGENPITACIQGSSVLMDNGPRQINGDSLEQDTTQVSSWAMVAETPDQVRTAIAVFAGPDFATCLNEGMRTMFEAEIAADGTELTLADVSTTGMANEPVDGDVVSYRVTAVLSFGDISVPGHLDVSLVSRGRSVAGLFVMTINEPYPDANRAGLLRTMTGRMPDSV